MNDTNLQELGQAVVRTEAEAVNTLLDRIDDKFTAACHHMLDCKGRIVVIGMGKSGHIGGKIAATLASTGSPAFFVHPGEASHGDLGMITANDVVIALSNSGETDEVLTILPLIKRLDIPMISLTGNPESTLAKESTVNLDVSVDKEACPLGLAPTSSTTVALVMGDALAIALLEARGFTADDFAMSHPGGSLGRRLLVHVSDIMHTGDEIPTIGEQATVREALLEISQKGMGMTAIISADKHIAGIFTDGDLRRAMDQGIDVHSTPIADIMTVNCTTVHSNILAAEALQIMESKKINGLFVTDDDGKLTGALNMHDLLRARVV